MAPGELVGGARMCELSREPTSALSAIKSLAEGVQTQVRGVI